MIGRPYGHAAGTATALGSRLSIDPNPLSVPCRIPVAPVLSPWLASGPGRLRQGTLAARVVSGLPRLPCPGLSRLVSCTKSVHKSGC